MPLKEDNGDYVAPAGSTVEPVYERRTMRCIVVTESELKQLGLANIVITVLASFGSFFIAFGLDVIKDVWLAESVPESANLLTNVIQPICIFLGVALYFAAGFFWFWRRDMLNLIKRESGNSVKG